MARIVWVLWGSGCAGGRSGGDRWRSDMLCVGARWCAPTIIGLAFVACRGPSQPSQSVPESPMAVHEAVSGEDGEPQGPLLLLPQAQFVWVEGEDGQRKPQPGPAKLVVLRPSATGFTSEIIEDGDSRVFHKAQCLRRGAGERQIMTIGGTDAHLKTWRREVGAWRGTSHWKGVFGGRWDRLRDVERGDVDGDGEAELVIGTHDQGVIVVAKPVGDGFDVRRIFAQPDTFIHEIEIGDVDGDGHPEIYATPSEPNKADKSQDGRLIALLAAEGGHFQPQVVAAFAGRHAKEILVSDIDGDGHDELYVAVEAKTIQEDRARRVLEPLEIRRYRKSVGGAWQGEPIARLPGGLQARVLVAGDPTGRGGKDIVVTTWKAGVWRLQPTDRGLWQKELIDAHSGGFEHAATLADLDGDGQEELYVSSEDDDAVRCYRYDKPAAGKSGKFRRTDVWTLARDDIVWSIEACMP